jgi:putative ABC transport system substrate-binding protein
MRRREFIAGVGSAALWVRAARAQQPTMPVIGWLGETTPGPLPDPFRRGLAEMGFIGGRNVAVEYRWADGNREQLSALASDLVLRRVSVIVAVGGNAASAAKAATAIIPIVFTAGADPVQIGLVASLSRPGGNVTGATTMAVGIGSKLLGLLAEFVPRAARITVLINPSSLEGADSYVNDLQAAASASGRQIEVLTARTNRDIVTAFASLVQKRADALVVSPDIFLLTRRVQIVTLAARHAVVTIYPSRGWAEAGGLMSYGSNLADVFMQAGVYTGRILKGEKPADLPVLRLTKFEFVINRATAEALGLEIPPNLLAIADEVVE